MHAVFSDIKFRNGLDFHINSQSSQMKKIFHTKTQFPRESFSFYLIEMKIVCLSQWKFVWTFRYEQIICKSFDAALTERQQNL